MTPFVASAASWWRVDRVLRECFDLKLHLHQQIMSSDDLNQVLSTDPAMAYLILPRRSRVRTFWPSASFSAGISPCTYRQVSDNASTHAILHFAIGYHYQERQAQFIAGKIRAVGSRHVFIVQVYCGSRLNLLGKQPVNKFQV